LRLERQSPCKVNLLLNILGKRPDGFHELETVMHPIAVFDTLTLENAGRGVELSCSEPTLPTDTRNLVHRAATAGLDDPVCVVIPSGRSFDPTVIPAKAGMTVPPCVYRMSQDFRRPV
jgi:4-diphosphocytidyl-2C-methyl-D-erythritol kinase